MEANDLMAMTPVDHIPQMADPGLRGEILKDVQMHVLTIYGRDSNQIGSTDNVLLAYRA